MAKRALQASPESTGPQKFTRGETVVYRRGRKHIRQLLAIVALVEVVPVGPPGPHRYRYMLRPAAIVNGVPVAIEAARNVDDIRGDQLETYDPATHDGNLAKWWMA